MAVRSSLHRLKRKERRRNGTAALNSTDDANASTSLLPTTAPSLPPALLLHQERHSPNVHQHSVKNILRTTQQAFDGPSTTTLPESGIDVRKSSINFSTSSSTTMHDFGVNSNSSDDGSGPYTQAVVLQNMTLANEADSNSSVGASLLNLGGTTHHMNTSWTGAACHAKFFHIGKPYYTELYDLVDKLPQGSEIILAGWMFALDFSLFGKGKCQKEDGIFKNWVQQIAAKGHHVYIQMWYTRASEKFAPWLHARKNAIELSKINPQYIHVFLDLGRGWSPNFRWSHHLKAVVINRQIAYVGGFDFKHGNYDVLPLNGNDRCRDPNEQHWLDVMGSFYGQIAQDVAKALVIRQSSYCANRSRFLEWQIFGGKYYQCEKQHVLPPSFDVPDRYPDQYAPGESKGPPHPKEKNECKLILTANNALMGVNKDTRQIYDAYLERIKEAQNSMLIENQYFVSERGSSGNVTQPVNLLMIEVAKKLEQKIDRGEPFSVIIFMPGLTEQSHMPSLKTLFAGIPDLSPGVKEKKLGRGLKQRVIDALEKNGKSKDSWKDYLFIGLAGVASENKFHGLAFVHSTTMMVDDKVAFVGTANLNDRSMFPPKASGCDAEMDVEIHGPAARRLLKETLYKFGVKPQSFLKHTNTSKIARLMYKVAKKNNDKLSTKCGIDMESGKNDEGKSLYKEGTDKQFLNLMAGHGEPHICNSEVEFRGYALPWTEHL